MVKLLLLITTLVFSSQTLSGSDIDKKISINQKILDKRLKQKKKTKVQVEQLALQIKKANKKMDDLNSKMSKLDTTIKKRTNQLNIYKNDLKILQLKSDEILKEKKKIQENIVDSIIENYASDIALDLANKKTIDEIISKYSYTIIANDSKQQVSKLDSSYDNILKNQKENERKIVKIKAFIKKDLEDKNQYKKLEKQFNRSLVKLKLKHKAYQKELQQIAKKQRSLQDLLGKLDIMKKEEIQESRKKERLKQERLAKKAAAKKKKQTTVQEKFNINRFNENLSMNVRNIGSSTSGAKITKYRGRKTIAPLKSFIITKRFGTTYDKVYKIKLFNDSITMKSKVANAKVYSVLSGKVVYSKEDSGLLENVVIIKHKNNIHTIYSHLDDIAPTIRKGKWVQKGEVIGRVNENLTFQATKNSKYINPKELF